MNIERVSFKNILGAPNADKLLREYSKECSIPEIGPTNPQPDMYEAMEGTGLMHTFAAYVENELVGFATILLYVLPHYGKKIASTESLFVSSDFRHFGIGTALLRTIEDFARDGGCKVLLYSAPSGSRLERLLDQKRGYRRTNAVFTRSL